MPFTSAGRATNRSARADPTSINEPETQLETDEEHCLSNCRQATGEGELRCEGAMDMEGLEGEDHDDLR